MIKFKFIPRFGLGLLFGLLAMTNSSGASATSAYDFTFPSIDGGQLALSGFAGKTVLVVNTASRCGYTPQYTQLQDLWERYRDKGLVVLGVPSNDFGGQEPGDEKEIKEFCSVNFNVDFPMTAKQQVSGDNAHPFYKWAAQRLGVMASPKWNFHKYVIGPDGQLVDWFSTVTDPTSDKVIAVVETSLKLNAK